MLVVDLEEAVRSRPNGYLYETLTTVAPSAKLALGLRRGATVSVVAGNIVGR